MTKKAALLSLCCMLAAVFAGAAIQQLTRELASPTATEPIDTMLGKAPPVTILPDLNGKPRYLEEWRQHVIVVNFWASWCAPCRHEIPEFVSLQRQYADQKLQFVGIAVQAADDIRAFLQEVTVNYPILVGDTVAIKLGRAYGNHTGALPYTVVIDRDGYIAYLHQGPISAAKLVAVIEPLL